MSTPIFFDQVYEVIRRIPRGRVTTYGRVAAMLGRPNAARAVGYALRASGRRRRGETRAADLPWYRVINSAGRISLPNMRGGADRQAELLRAEGVVVSDDLLIDLSVYLWEGLHPIEIDDILSGRGEP